ncbi:hypothetical protein P12x_000677 [Tundrisphaera lichenicola]|uniref:hypothetical protein n=1 Tax=Tundrisphaera lichenicola TaxID=2029860 RepID=UPI003EBC5A10
MRSFGAWVGRVAVAATCLAWVGCGGSDVPDPDSDSAAAEDASPQVVDRGGASAPEAPSAPEPAAPARPEPIAATGAPSAIETAQPAPVAEPEPVASSVKGDASGTEDMLRIAATPTAAPAETPTPGAAGGMAGGPPGYPGAGGPPGYPGASGPPGYPGSGGPPGYPGAGGPPGSTRDSLAAVPGATPGYPGSVPGEVGPPGGYEAMRPGMAAGPGGPPGFGGPGGIGGPGGLNGPDAAPVGPDTFLHPNTAVEAFISALKLKDRDRLAEATARRASTEAAEKHQKIFESIIDGSISDDELDEMSKALGEFKVAGVLPAKSSGKVGVVVSKMEGRDRHQRTIMTRKEKEGWKVLDVGSELEFKAPPSFSKNRRR